MRGVKVGHPPALALLPHLSVAKMRQGGRSSGALPEHRLGSNCNLSGIHLDPLIVHSGMKPAVLKLLIGGLFGEIAGGWWKVNARWLGWLKSREWASIPVSRRVSESFRPDPTKG